MVSTLHFLHLLFVTDNIVCNNQNFIYYYYTYTDTIERKNYERTKFHHRFIVVIAAEFRLKKDIGD